MAKILIDTNVLIWWLAYDKRLTKQTISLIQDNQVYVSIISCWEILIKVQIKKLKLPISLSIALEDSDFDILALEMDHVLNLNRLTMHHRDPFDRILIAQALAEDLTIVTSDKTFKKYPVQVIKAWIPYDFRKRTYFPN